MIGDLITSLDALALALLAEFSRPTVVADGTMPGIVVRATSVHRDVKPENVPPGLVPCTECGRPERPGAVHFPTNTAMRPCAGSWGSR